MGMKGKFAQNMEVPVSLMGFLLQTQVSFGEFFLFEVLHFTMIFTGIGLIEILVPDRKFKAKLTRNNIFEGS